MSLFRKRPSQIVQYGPPSELPDNQFIWATIDGLGVGYGVMAELSAAEASHELLKALEQQEVVRPNAPVYSEIGISLVRSSGYVLDSSGWEILFFGVEDPTGHACAIAFWVPGMPDEMARFQGRLQQINIQRVVRRLGGVWCVIKKGTVAEGELDMNRIFSRSWPPLSTHELGRRLATWPLVPIESR